MKKLFILLFAFTSVILVSCGNGSDKPVTNQDSVTTGGPDSAANNGIIPPSAAPGNAGNSSLADTAYHAKDSTKK